MTWFLRNWEQVAIALGEHLVIAGTALAIAFVLSLAIGIAAARNQRIFDAAMAVSGILYTIPTLAFLALLRSPLRPRRTASTSLDADAADVRDPTQPAQSPSRIRHNQYV
jgi:ABC-type dipeptide/oligopeptide/nickel transport system permease subunit